MFNDPLVLTGATSAGNVSLPRINIDSGLGEFNKFTTSEARSATIKHTSYKAKGMLATQRHTVICERVIKRVDATNSNGYINVPYKAYIVIEHDDNAVIGELAEVVANVTNFIPTDNNTVLSQLMNREV